MSQTALPRRARTAVATLLLATLALLLSGCLRTEVDVSINSDDRVSGRMIVAQRGGDDDTVGPQLRIQDSLRTRARVQPWTDEGFVGSELIFSDLSFADFRQLALTSSDVPGSFDVRLTRNGSDVTLTGRADLRNIGDGAQIRISVTFPSSVESTNGDQTSNRSVTWTPSAGQLSTFRAETRYTDPNTRSFAGWAGFVIGASVAAAVVVGALSWFSRNRSPKPGDLVH
ncbi:DUF3153 domain-containing protein [Hoyosella sp. G463]|uniref:DUF3153 domain-containing protein n=1 Tax=Lolliginicoccus lacisalsi TaxID=2742202 RepID=A0A927JF71_9ACTN|nr:DUF3153 domain-containing protein [Lolliginicoccus lacisalsi]MBD8507747.1 DUF3153 domain-containing protein [Lolliginicoccus lacisalsi]